MTNKHIKTDVPTDADLKANPMIGGTTALPQKGASQAEIEEAEGDTTFPGDTLNDTNAAGGINKNNADPSPRHKQNNAGAPGARR